MLHPKRTKFRKYQKGRVQGILSNTTMLQYGRYGIKALENGRIPAKILEAVRRVLTRKFKRTGQIWIRVFPDIAISAKPAEVRFQVEYQAEPVSKARQSSYLLFVPHRLQRRE